MSVSNSELMPWLTHLRQQVEKTNPGFAALKPGVCPIPFFGDIRTARVLTIGVNPSPTEFNPGRWDQITNDSEWADRLVNYFHVSNVPWHRWFLPWEAALRLLGCSYENRTAAHLDLSPRATTTMGQIGDELRPAFCSMVAGDVHWLFEALRFAPSARLLLAAGTMIEPMPNEWLKIATYLEKRLELYGAQVSPNSRLIIGLGFPIRLYRFNNGPAAQDKFKLIEEVFAVREQLLPFLR